MARTIYIASPEGDTGKSTVALGLVDLLTRTVQRVGVFRPVARSTEERDYVLELLLAHDGVDLAYDDAVGVTYEQVLDDPDAALARIVQRFHDVDRRCDAVVVVGSDYTDVAGPTELAYNARVAANLGAPTVLVVSGRGRTPDQVHQVVELGLAEMDANHAQVVAVVANRCAPDDLDEIRARIATPGVPAWAMPEDPLLIAPTLRELADTVGAHLIGGDEELMSREVLDVLVGAMSVEHLLDRLRPGAVVITPGDRHDVLLGLLLAHQAESFASLAGIVLTGGMVPAPTIGRLLGGLGSRLPLLSTDLGTFRSATLAANTRGRLTRASQRKIDTALALFETHVDGAGLLAALDVPRVAVVTPLMFEYTLLDRARSELEGRHFMWVIEHSRPLLLSPPGVPSELDDFLDQISVPVVLVSFEGLVVTANQKACAMLGKDLAAIEGKLGGEVFECAYAYLPGGCGNTYHCSGCTIRRSVMDTHLTGKTAHRVPATLKQNSPEDPQQIKFLISTEKFKDYVMLKIHGENFDC